MKRGIIVGAAPLGRESQLLKDYLLSAEEFYTIAADGGIRYFMEQNIKPDRFLGDLDSFDEAYLDKVKEQFPDLSTDFVSPIKDDTDAELAVNTAIEMGCDDILIFGGLGGDRISHTIANIQLINGYYDRGVRITLYGPGIKIFVLSDGDEVVYPIKKEGFLSVFALSPQCENISLTGLKYNYEGSLTSKRALGVSNQLEQDGARIAVGKGDLLVVEELE